MPGYVRPGFDLADERLRREQAGVGEHLDEKDLYPDVRTALKALQDTGIQVGIAGNQTARAAELLHELHLPADAIATSGQWGAAKPDPAVHAATSAVIDTLDELPALINRTQ